MSESDSSLDPNTRVNVTLMIRHPATAAFVAEQLLAGEWRPASREDAEQAISADVQDLAAVRLFAQQYGLTILDENGVTRTVHLEGSAEAMEKAFGVQLLLARDANGQVYLSYQGAISLPRSLEHAVTAVLGLDQHPVARPRAGSYLA